MGHRIGDEGALKAENSPPFPSRGREKQVQGCQFAGDTHQTATSRGRDDTIRSDQGHLRNTYTFTLVFVYHLVDSIFVLVKIVLR